jgi:hypothetical protein
VSFVDREERDLRAVQQIKAARRSQALGRNVKQVELACQQRALGRACSAGVERGVEERSVYAKLGERSDLILHQGDQRRHDDARTRPYHRGNLIAQRLAPSGRHQNEGVATGHDMVDHVFLSVAEGRVAEYLAQNLSCRGHSRWRDRTTPARPGE